MGNWWILIRTLYSSEKLQKNESLEKEYERAKFYMQYLSDQGCAKPTLTHNTQVNSKKGHGDKLLGTNTKSILIPRDLEKLIRTERNKQLDTTQLTAIR